MMMPVIMSVDPIKVPNVMVSLRIRLLKASPKMGTSNVEMVAVTISTMLSMRNQPVKQKADARTPLNRI